MARILITGARGFIGRHVAREFAAVGHAVHGLGHGIWPDAEARAWGVSAWLNGDVSSASLRTLQRSFGNPDHVVHLAGGASVGTAIANPREDFFRTVATTAELLDWMRLDAPGASLLAVSSAAVYGAGHAGCIAENSALTPYSPYGHHKRLMEELCRSYAASYGLRVTVARLFSVYGPGLKKQLLWDLCSRLAAGADPLTLGGTGDELRDWTDVRDVSRALRLLMPRADNSVPVFNVGTGLGTSVREVATALARTWGAQTGGAFPPVDLEFSGQSRPGDPFSLVADAARLAALGFSWSIDLPQGLADYVRWHVSAARDAAS